MSKHLTQDQIERFRQRLLPPEELLSADDHLSCCNECRSHLAQDDELESAVEALRREFELVDIEPFPHPLRDELSAFMGGGLSEVDREIIGSHLESCSLCREEFDKLRTGGRKNQ